MEVGLCSSPKSNPESRVQSPDFQTKSLAPTVIYPAVYMLCHFGTMSQQNQILCDVVQRGFVGASHYENTRQDYPVEAVEFFLNNLGVKDIVRQDRPFTILEVGCGTGKFTRVMLKILELKEDQNIKVIASEPHQNMYEEFKLIMPDTEIIQCTAEKIRK